MVVKPYPGLISALCLLSSCAYNPAPVSVRVAPPREIISHHIVSPGDTMFAIAWRYEKELVALARVNKISPPYKIRVGQRLNLDTSSLSTTRLRTSESIMSERPPLTRSSKTTEVRSIDRSVAKKTTIVKRPSLKPAYKFSTGKVRWQWPAIGPVSRYYDASKIFKGINIQSSAGRPVKATADGVVVYAGSGLRGYGKLIIVKHSATYLSAYAHNKVLLVKEGDALKRGTKIATIGGDSSNSGRLYFEIRKNGKPVDPMRLLPKQ